MKRSFAIAWVLLAAPLLSQAAIINGTFELGNVGFTSEYAYAPEHNTTEGEYTVSADPKAWNGKFADMPDHTTGFGKMLVVNGATQGNLYLWRQEVTVEPFTTYLFSAWVASAVADGPADLSLQINGATVGPSFTAPDETGTWDLWGRSWDAGAATVADIRIYNTDLSWYPNDFYIDDIFFVPEPAACSILALGALAVGVRRRSRRPA